MQKYICMYKTVKETWAKRQSCAQNYLIMRLPRQVCGVLWLIFKSTLSSLDQGVRGVSKCSFSCSWGQESPWLLTGFSLLFWQVPPHCSLCSLMTPCVLLEMGFGVLRLRRKKPLPRCANPLWQPLHHTWPPMAGLHKVNDCCATEVTYAHWSLQCAHKRGPPPLLEQLNAFLLRNLHNLRAIFSPHSQAPLKPFSHSRASI